MQIAVLGLGAMGARMASRLLEAGHALAVYNRTPARAAALVSAGAVLFETPGEAARAADLVFAMVRDDEASRAVWLGDGGALETLDAGTVAIDCSTLSPAWTRALTRTMAARNQPFLAAPVIGSRPHAEGGTLTVLAGGDPSALERARPALETIGRVAPVSTPTQAAARKLAVNALFAVQAAAMGEVLGLLEAHGVDRQSGAAFLSGLPVTSPAAARLAGLMAAADYAPNFPVDLVAKDLGYAAEASGAGARTLAGARDAFRAASAAGFGGDDIAGVAQLQLR